MKRLDLYSINYNTFQAKHIVTDVYQLAGRVALKRYENLDVGTVFSGTTILSMDMLHAMMLDNPTFDKVDDHMGAIGGLGDAYQFVRFFDQHILIEMNRRNPLNAFEAILHYYGSTLFVNELHESCISAIRNMFTLIRSDGLGLGVFHDPFVALAAHFLGFKEARSLQDMESITFLMDDDGKISVLGINEVLA